MNIDPLQVIAIVLAYGPLASALLAIALAYGPLAIALLANLAQSFVRSKRSAQ